MYISVITHAAAREKKHGFRGLTERGWQEANSAAARYRALLQEAGTDVPPVDLVVSSPKPRCLETVILFAKGLDEAMKASEVQVDGDLKAGSIEGPELDALAQSTEAAHVLVAGHADMVKTLPGSAALAPGAQNGGWFAHRPVLFALSTERAASWDEAQILFCEANVAGTWTDLLQR